MYKIKYKKKSSLELPISSFTERYKALIGSDKKQVVYIKQVFDNSTFRYRAYNVQQALEHSQKYGVHYFLTSEIEMILPALDSKSVGAVVFQRAYWNDDIQRLLDWCEVNAITTAFDIDDYIYEPNCLPELFFAMNWGTDKFDGTMLSELSKQAALHDIVASQCKYLITTNSFLGKRLKDFFKKKVFIIPNFMNNEQEAASHDAVAKKKSGDGNFTIGYFSGSASHENDFQTISSELAAILRDNKTVNVKIVGFMQLPHDLKDFRNRISSVPFVSYVDLQYEMASVDVNIVPLIDATFTNCKSDLKYFEAAAVKTPTIASPSFAYEQSIRSGANGFLCKQGEWASTLDSLINDNELLHKVADAAYDDSKRYSPASQQNTIEGVFGEIIT